MQSSNPYLDRRQRFPTAYERMTARLHHLLQGVADASVCRHSPKGLPLLIFLGFTPIAFVSTDIPYKAARGFVCRVTFP